MKTGLDVLVEQDFAPIAGKRVGVITNHSGLTWDHRHIVKVLAASKKIKLTAIFSPEHGLSGNRRRRRRRRLRQKIPRRACRSTACSITALQAHARNAEKRGCAGLRHSGRRRPVLHLPYNARLCARSGGAAKDPGICSRPAEPDQRHRRGRPAARSEILRPSSATSGARSGTA